MEHLQLLMMEILTALVKMNVALHVTMALLSVVIQLEHVRMITHGVVPSQHVLGVSTMIMK